MSRLPPAIVKEDFMTVRKNILVKGFVQGVSYRKQTKRVAQRLGVKGWVRNISNGTVEACLEGEEQAVDAVIAWCAFGPTRGKVDEVQILVDRYDGRYADFCIWKDRKAA
jgi:acylphosphatase